MTKEQKILLLFVLLASGIGATMYVSQKKEAQEDIQMQDAPSKESSQNSEVKETTQTQQQTQVETTPSKETNTAPSVIEQPQKISKAITYAVPEEHKNTLTVNVVVSKGIIVDVTFSENPTNKESEEYYEKFMNNFQKSQVVGKKLGEVSLTRVGGASLTTKAFNNALQQMSTNS